MPAETGELAHVLFRRFFRGHERYAIMTRGADGSVKYRPVEEPPTAELIQRHLNRELTLGAYSLDSNSCVNLVAFDIDGNREHDRPRVENIAREIKLNLLERFNIEAVVEFSGNKGYHVIIFLDEPVPAGQAKAWAERLAESLNLERRVTESPHVEIYPKQEIIEGERIGNLLKLPLGVHLKTRSMSYLCGPDLNEVPPLPELQRGYQPSVLALSDPTGTPIDAIVNIIGPRMGPGARNLTFFNLCGYLARNLWEESDVSALLDALDAAYGPFDLDNLRGVIERTFRRVTNQESIVYTLRDLELSEAEAQRLDEAVSMVSADPTLLAANRIIASKKQGTVERARMLSSLIRRHMMNFGEVCQDEDGHLYWLQRSSGKLYSTRSRDSWELLLFQIVQYLKKDHVFALAEEDLYKTLRNSAPVRKVARLSYWDKASQTFYLSLGGPWVYILDGHRESRRAVFNGDGLPILFDNLADTHNFPNLLESTLAPKSPWETMLEDVNFSDYEGVKAEQSKELVKVWMLAVLFPSLMATRPLLSVIAPPGAGKTTFARRIVRFFEGPSAEVLTVMPDKPDSLRSQAIMHKVMCLDNLERSGSSWIADDLNRLATGVKIELRQLYTTNNIETYRPDVYIILTATRMPFQEETVFSRMLPVPLETIPFPLPESELQEHLAREFERAWLGMLDVVDEAILSLRDNANTRPAASNRLADFVFFAAQLCDVTSIDRIKINQALLNFTASQQTVRSQHSPTIRLLQLFSETDPVGASQWRNAADLYRKLVEVGAHANPRIFPPRTAKLMEQDCTLLVNQLLAIQFETEVFTPTGEQPVTKYRFVGSGAQISEARRVSLTRLPADATVD